MGAFGWLHFSPQSRQAGMPRPVGSGTGGHAAVNLLPGHGACMNTKVVGSASVTTVVGAPYTAAVYSSSSPHEPCGRP